MMHCFDQCIPSSRDTKPLLIQVVKCITLMWLLKTVFQYLHFAGQKHVYVLPYSYERVSSVNVCQRGLLCMNHAKIPHLFTSACTSLFSCWSTFGSMGVQPFKDAFVLFGHFETRVHTRTRTCISCLSGLASCYPFLSSNLDLRLVFNHGFESLRDNLEVR